jgi:hypothetical protein
MKHERVKCLIICLAFLSSYVCFADDVGITLQTGGTQIVLPAGWEELNQPKTLFVQQRPHNLEKGIALSAGTIRSDLTFEQYAAIGIAGYIRGPEKQMERIAELAHIPVEKVEKALQSQIGSQTLEQVKRSYSTMSFGLLGVIPFRIMVFGFEKDDEVCVIIENAPLDGYKKFANDFETIRETFKLK